MTFRVISGWRKNAEASAASVSAPRAAGKRGVQHRAVASSVSRIADAIRLARRRDAELVRSIHVHERRDVELLVAILLITLRRRCHRPGTDSNAARRSVLWTS